jgi:fumiquinazoline F synthetase
VGRKDSQVKIHGQRIELGEIEKTLASQGQIAQTLVTVPHRGPCQNQLVAFISFSDVGTALKTSKSSSSGYSTGRDQHGINLLGGCWRSHVRDAVDFLQDKLPSYMVPEMVVCVEEIPKNISGKLDRMRMQEYAEELDNDGYRDLVTRITDGQHQDHCRPGSEIEKKLRVLWSEILCVPESQILWDSSFFFVGGDSISAMMISHAARQKGILVTARDIIRHRRIDRLAEFVSIQQESRREPKRPVIVPEEIISSQPFPLSPIQRLHFATHGVGGDNLDQQTLVLEIMESGKSRSDYQRLLRDLFCRLLEVHPMLRARFRVNDEGKVEQTIAAEDDRRNVRLRLHSESQTDYILDCVSEAILCVNISEGPLIAVDIFEGGEARMIVSMSIHHLVIDTVSWRIILGDLENSFRSGDLRSLEPEPVYFRDWSCALAEEFLTEDDEERLRDMAADRQLDASSANPSCPDFWGMQGKSNTFNDIVVRTFELDAVRTGSLMASWEETGYGLVDMLCSSLLESFQTVFGRLPQLYLEGHGREPFHDKFVDVGGVVGWFTTFAPLVLPQALDPAAKEEPSILKQVFEARNGMQLNGLACFSRQQLTEQTEKAGHAPMEITLNYLGSFQQLENSVKLDSIFRVHDKDNFQARLSAIKLQQRGRSTRYSLISAQFRHTRDRICGEITWNRNMRLQSDLLAWVDNLERVLVEMQSTRAKTQPPPNALDENRLAQLAPSCSVPMEVPSTIHMSPDITDRILAFVRGQLGISARDIEQIYPCSPVQESIMLSQLKARQESALDVYEQQFLFEVIPSDQSTNFEINRLLEAWREVVRRHAIMRTIFVEDNAGFFQVVLRQHSPDVQVISAHEDTTTEIPELQIMRQDHGLKHPLSGSVLHGLTVIERPSAAGASRVFCRLTKSHLISCGYTSRLLIRDLLDTYDGFDCHLRGNYSHFIEYIFQQDIQDMVNWWAKFLDGASPCILPRTLQKSLEPKGTKNVDGSSGTTFLRIGAAIKDRQSLSLACQQHDLSSTSIMCAAWGITLRTYMGNLDDVLFGLMFWGRDLPIPRALEIMGPMINMLPVRVQFKEGTTVNEVCQEFQSNYFEQLARQTVSLGKIQNGVDSLRGRGPIFNTLVNVQKVREFQHEQDRKRSHASLLFSHDTTEYDVALGITETEHGVELSLEFRTEFMSKVQAERVLQTFVGIVESIANGSACTIETLSVATALDLEQLRQWNKMPLKPYHACIHQMIRARSSCSGQAERPAVSSWDGSLTYWELEYLSSALSSIMLEQGVGPGDVVALCFEKSLWGVVCMLAVAKAGAAFIQIHPDYPLNRCKAILDQAQPTMGLASQSKTYKLQGILTHGTVITVPWSSNCLARIPAKSQDIMKLIDSGHSDPSDAMYLISTSGTTGAPKIVVIEHQSFCSAVASNRERLQQNSESRVLQFTDYCFDACLEEIFTVLVAGGCICIPSDTQRLSDVATFIKEHKVNWAALTPSLMRTLRPEDIAPPVNFITVHAEPMTQALVDAWAGTVQVRPSYGPSECSVTSSVGADFHPGANAANIGWPVGCHAWIVSPENHDILMPVGAVGELVLQGPIVGRGYLGNDERTAAAFISPPAWATHFMGHALASDSRLALRMYKTSDLVRFDPEDGSLLIQARKDASQVKVRGQRVELKEIEHYLDKCEAIQHGLIVVPQHGELHGRLVAVVSLLCLEGKSLMADADLPLNRNHGGNRASRIQLVRMSDLDRLDAENTSHSILTAKEFLSRHLPRYMFPETWVVVRKVPVTISHKLDRKQVIQWVEGLDRLSMESIHELRVQDNYGTWFDTLNEEERKIQVVWGQVLGIDPGKFIFSSRKKGSVSL